MQTDSDDTDPSGTSTMTVAVEALLREVVAPLLAADGGGLELVAIASGRAVVRLTGVCGGCPGAPYTLSGIIEPAVRSIMGPETRVVIERSPGRISEADNGLESIS